jgi:UMF1 family MFS transporter
MGVASPTASPTAKREQISWYFYDWANSAFSTTVVSVFLGPYLTSITQNAADSSGFVYPFGIPVAADSFFPYMVSLSVLLQVAILPIMGAVADYTHLKKQFMGFFAFVGSFATMGLYFLQGDLYWLGGLLFVIANLSFGTAMVCYNAFLPEISTPDERDKVSSYGWALGYLGGGLLLAMNLVFFNQAESLGIEPGHAVRISMMSAGFWWFLFTLIPLRGLRSKEATRKLPPGETYLSAGFSQLRQTLRKLPSYPHTLLFLIAYLLYNDGVQTVIALAGQFGAQELGMETSALITLILMVQFIAFFGALIFGRLARWIGAKQAIIVSLFIWVGTMIYTFGFLSTQAQYFAVGAVIALVLGGSQALSRSLFSQMIPAGQESEYFSLYEVSERGTSWMGPLVFGLALQFTDSYRVAILSVSIFFIAGLLILPRVNVRRAIEEAGNVAPEKV